MPNTPTHPNAWTTIATPALLAPGEVHIYRVDTSASNLLTLCEPHLTPDELSHANRRRQPHDRRQAIISRGTLRILLGAASHTPPKAVPITLGPHKKPQHPALSFNVSHSRDILLIALAHQANLGIDVEHIDPTIDFLEIAHHSFTPAEIQSLTSIPDPALQRRAFYQHWTRKEAFAKADGRGLLLPLSSFEISLTHTLTASPQQSPIKKAHITDICLTPDTTAALVSDLDLTPKLLMFVPA